MKRGEKIIGVGFLMVFIATASISNDYWQIGLIVGLIGLLVMGNGYEIIQIEEANKKKEEIKRRKKHEATQKAKLAGKEATWQAWLNTKRMGGTF